MLNGVFILCYVGCVVSDDVLSLVMVFFVFFVVLFGFLFVFFVMIGLDFLIFVFGVVVVIVNIGSGLGDIIGLFGNFSLFNDIVKWFLVIGMLVGWFEFLVVFVIFIF